MCIVVVNDFANHAGQIGLNVHWQLLVVSDAEFFSDLFWFQLNLVAIVIAISIIAMFKWIRPIFAIIFVNMHMIQWRFRWILAIKFRGIERDGWIDLNRMHVSWFQCVWRFVSLGKQLVKFLFAKMFQPILTFGFWFWKAHGRLLLLLLLLHDGCIIFFVCCVFAGLNRNQDSGGIWFFQDQYFWISSEQFACWIWKPIVFFFNDHIIHANCQSFAYVIAVCIWDGLRKLFLNLRLRSDLVQSWMQSAQNDGWAMRKWVICTVFFQADDCFCWFVGIIHVGFSFHLVKWKFNPAAYVACILCDHREEISSCHCSSLHPHTKFIQLLIIILSGPSVS